MIFLRHNDVFVFFTVLLFLTDLLVTFVGFYPIVVLPDAQPGISDAFEILLGNIRQIDVEDRVFIQPAISFLCAVHRQSACRLPVLWRKAVN